MYAWLVAVAPDTMLTPALCACNVSILNRGTACWLIAADIGFPMGAVALTAEIFPFLRTIVACTIPKGSLTAEPLKMPLAPEDWPPVLTGGAEAVPSLRLPMAFHRRRVADFPPDRGALFPLPLPDTPGKPMVGGAELFVGLDEGC